MRLSLATERGLAGQRRHPGYRIAPCTRPARSSILQSNLPAFTCVYIYIYMDNISAWQYAHNVAFGILTER